MTGTTFQAEYNKWWVWDDGGKTHEQMYPKHMLLLSVAGLSASTAPPWSVFCVATKLKVCVC